MDERQHSQLSTAEILEECEALEAQHRAMQKLFPGRHVREVRELL